MALPKSLLSLLLAASLTGSFALSALAADDAQTHAPAEVPAETLEPAVVTDPFLTEELPTPSGEWDRAVNPRIGQSDTMNLLHEAMLWAAQADLALASPQPEQSMALYQTAEEPVRLTGADCYTLYGDNIPLCVVEMTGIQLRDWLEECAGRYTIIYDGSISVPEGTDQIYGISYDIYLGNPAGMRLANMTYGGRPITAEQTFRVALSAAHFEEEGAHGFPAVTSLNADDVIWASTQEKEPESPADTIPKIVAAYIKTVSQEGSFIAPKARSHWNISRSSSAQALASVTRLAFVEALYEGAGRPTAYLDLEITFSDMDGKNPAAAWATQAGIVLGNGSGQFLPDTPVTREQALIMLLRYDIARGAGPVGAWAVGIPYTDAAKGSAWASEALMWNVIRGYLPPDDAGRLNPQSILTREQLEYAISQLGK